MLKEDATARHSSGTEVKQTPVNAGNTEPPKNNTNQSIMTDPTKLAPNQVFVKAPWKKLGGEKSNQGINSKKKKMIGNISSNSSKVSIRLVLGDMDVAGSDCRGEKKKERRKRKNLAP